jgi:cardiolipin synthase
VARAIISNQFQRAALLIGLAGLTDALDGFLARKLKSITRAGAYLDPIADKLLLVLVFVALGVQGAVPIWLTGLVLGRDGLILLMVAIALLFTNVRSFPPSILGKISTIVQVFTALIIVLERAWSAERTLQLDWIWIGATAAATVVSGIAYIYIALRAFPSARREYLGG